AVCDRIAVMKEGLIVETGVPDQLRDDPQHPNTRQLMLSRPAGLPQLGLPMTDPAITVDALGKTFRTGRRGHTVVALDGVSLTVEKGTCLAVVGESGSGKTTLPRIIVGLERADSGSVTVGGVSVGGRAGRRERRRRAAHIQMVFQDPLSS